MDRRDVLSFSAINVFNDARLDGSSGLSAVRRHRPLLVIPVLCALAYPALLSLLSSGLVLVQGSASPDGVIGWVGVIAAVTLALAVMLVSFVFGRTLGSHVENPQGVHDRGIAHLAFATPSLYVGFGNVAGVLHAPSAVPIAWVVFWASMAMIILLASSSSPPAVAATPFGHRRLALAHGVSACAILLLFVGPHLANHMTGLWNGPLHIEVMNTVRRVYRDDIVQPILLALIGFQILSGTVLLLRWRMRMPSDFLGTVQTMTGVYVGIYFLGHATAVFAARHAGTDTNWSWLTRPNNSMLVSLSNLRLIAHYWMGPVAIISHVACGLRMVLLQHGVLPAVANRVALALIILGFIVSSVILIALLNVHVA
jgi:hypothetical protein